MFIGLSLQNAGNGHLITLHEKTIADSSIYIGRKLTREHLMLTLYSRMNVRLAAQVMLTYATMFMFLPYYMTDTY